MKELSIEEKAKRYDEAIEVARKIKNGEPINVPDGTLISVAIFPELKESEDERIRKWLIRYFKEVCDNVSEKEKKSVLDWLEKQGEQKPAWSEEDENAIQVLKDIVKHSNEINENIYTMPLKEKLYDWLKSLRPQNRWKPSEEQMLALDRAQAELCSTEYNKPICDLIDSLNKLREN